MIDAHHHLWTYSADDYPWIELGSPLHADFGPAELEAVAKPMGVTGSIVVQARQSVEESRWLLSLADDHPFIRAVVGWVPLADPAVGDTLADLAAHHAFRGVRHVVQDEPDGFLLSDAFNAGIDRCTEAGLVYDLLIYGRQLPEAIAFVDRHPEQTFVLDHLGKPTIQRSQHDEQWDRDIRQLAERPNVWAKVSGLVTEVRDPEWSVETLRPYWDTAIEAFGIDRLMFGSDWPVALLASDYSRWVEAARMLANSLSEAEQAGFFHANAGTAYGLTPQGQK